MNQPAEDQPTAPTQEAGPWMDYQQPPQTQPAAGEAGPWMDYQQSQPQQAAPQQQAQPQSQSDFQPMGAVEGVPPPVLQQPQAVMPKLETEEQPKSPEQITRAPEELRPAIQQAAANYKLDPKMVQAVIEQESGFKPNATGKAGERGLMQIMPGTAKHLGLSWDDAYDPVKNVEAGAKYLRELIDQHGGSEKEAIMHYNAGKNVEAGEKYYAAVMSHYGKAAKQEREAEASPSD